METIKNTKVLGVVGNILIIISLFLKWVTVSSISTGITLSSQFIDGKDGQVALLLSIISLFIIFAENISTKFFKGLTNVKLTLITTIIQLLMIVNSIFNISNVTETDITCKYSLGFYLMCIGVVLLIFFPFVYKQNKQKI